MELTRYKGITVAETLRREGEGASLPASFLAEWIEIRDEVCYRVKYKGYIDREQRQIDKLDHIEKIRIPPDMDFLTVKGLRQESALKLAAFKPFTLGQASRISGVNPSDISLLMVKIAAAFGK